MAKSKGYGYVSDTDESLQSSARPDFGGNFGVTVPKSIAYKENVAKEGNDPREAIEIEILVKDKKEMIWFSPISKVFSNGAEISEDHADYDKEYNAKQKQEAATLTHWLKAFGATDEKLKAALENKAFDSFKAYAETAIAQIDPNYTSKRLDIFYEYQWNIGTDKNGQPNPKTYPQIPRNMKGGYFVVPAQPGEWREVRGDDGSLRFVDSAGNEHPIKRTGDFMKSNKGTQQFLDGAGEEDAELNPMATESDTPTGSGW